MSIKNITLCVVGAPIVLPLFLFVKLPEIIGDWRARRYRKAWLKGEIRRHMPRALRLGERSVPYKLVLGYSRELDLIEKGWD